MKMWPDGNPFNYLSELLGLSRFIIDSVQDVPSGWFKNPAILVHGTSGALFHSVLLRFYLN
jgi:hypothetical protein